MNGVGVGPQVGRGWWGEGPLEDDLRSYNIIYNLHLKHYMIQSNATNGNNSPTCIH